MSYKIEFCHAKHCKQLTSSAGEPHPSKVACSYITEERPDFIK
ncbi:hypothetical protein [Pseudobutyrivibrio xylanivorans]|nr:hypothetical protein [Pseudobutyrivibrio xylanivorans]